MITITYSTMLYAPHRKVVMSTYAEVVAWLLLMAGRRPHVPLLVIEVRES